MTRTYADYMARAEALLTTGFHFEAGRKDALDYASRAFDCLHDEVSSAVLALRDAGTLADRSDEFIALYYEFPHTPAHWNAKRRKLFAARFPDACERADNCAALRERIKAAALTPKPKSAARVALEADEAKAKTCQVCGRRIQSNSGLVAHHGYERPGSGWQTASCMGARYVPFEVSRDRLGDAIRSLESRARDLAAYRVRVKTEAVELSREWSTRENPGQYPARHKTHSGTFTRATFEAFKSAHPAAFEGNRSATFEDMKARELASVDRDARHVEMYRKEAQARFDAWPGVTHKWTGEDWEAVA